MRLLDTDTTIGILRARPAVLARRARCTDTVSTTWVTASELYFGAAKSLAPVENSGVVTALLRTLDVLGPDLASARLFGEVKATLGGKGLSIADADLFIAAIALANNAVLVTGNTRHFDRIPGIVLEDWLR